MADTGVKSPTTTGSPSNQWSTPSNGFSSNNSYATETTDNQAQDYATFAFGVPADAASIDGIKVEVEAKTINPPLPLPDTWTGGIDVSLSWNAGTNYTAIKTNQWENTFGEIYQTYGGATDTWGRTWAASEFSDANFRAKVTLDKLSSGGMSMDHIRITVYYTAAGGATIRRMSLQGVM